MNQLKTLLSLWKWKLYSHSEPPEQKQVNYLMRLLSKNPLWKEGHMMLGSKAIHLLASTQSEHHTFLKSLANNSARAALLINKNSITPNKELIIQAQELLEKTQN